MTEQGKRQEMVTVRKSHLRWFAGSVLLGGVALGASAAILVLGGPRWGAEICTVAGGCGLGFAWAVLGDK